LIQDQGQNAMFRIRFHGRGGQGIKTASRILGSAFFNEGYEVQDAPVYGAERRGAPMFAYVRAARTPILERGVISHPDLVIVADESLVPVPAANVLQGVTDRSVLLINSAESPETWKERLKRIGSIVTLAVSTEVTERAELPYIGAMCAGAAACLTGVIRRAALEDAIRTELGAHGEAVVAQNLKHALAAFDAMQGQASVVTEGGVIAATEYANPEWVELPFEAARVAAPDVFSAGTSVQVKTGLWRTMRPVIDYELCHHCTWVCSTLCPDSAIHVRADGAPEIDYDHCKGCLICATVCPPHAIRALPERAVQVQETEGAKA
jgi:pyruvate ferredoxin oxidoreductase gamma subunit